MTCEAYAPLLPPIKMGTRRLDAMLAQAKTEQCGFVVIAVDDFEKVIDIVRQARECAADTGYNFNLGEFE